MNDTQNRLQDVLSPHLKFHEGDTIDPNADLGDLGLDSLSTITVLLDVEDEFAVEIPEELLEDDTFSTLAMLADVVDKIRAEG